MGEYADENIQRYAWVLQRMVIAAAVIIAVPVMMWTISTFIRSYVARPSILASQHSTLTELTESPPPASSVAASVPLAPQTLVQPAPAPLLADTVTTGNDDRAPFPRADALKGSLLEPTVGDADPVSGPPLRGTLGSPPPISTVAGSSTSPPVTAPAAAAPADAAAPPAPAPTADVTPRIATNGPGTTAAVPTNRGFARSDPNADSPNSKAPPQPPTTAETASAETLPAPEPIKGRIPLPRHRPSERAMAATPNMTAPLPVPRVRPADAPVDTSPPTNAPYGYDPSPSRH